MKKQLTVIIPVYNGEHYIAACLRALLQQWREEVEIVVVNDGSTDCTDQILCDEFGEATLTYIKTTNGGVSAARNTGMRAATGDYLAFVDADDIVAESYINAILEAIKSRPDIIEFGYRTIDTNGIVVNPCVHIHTLFGVHDAKQVLNRVYGAGAWYSWARVFSAELIGGAEFPKGVRYCEDLILLSSLYRKAHVINTLDKILYDYRINPAGATLNIKPDDALPLIHYYREIQLENRTADKALKVCMAYAMRRSVARPPDLFGELPIDIENDLRSLVWSMPLYFTVRFRTLVFAIWGARFNRIKQYIADLKKKVNRKVT